MTKESKRSLSKDEIGEIIERFQPYIKKRLAAFLVPLPDRPFVMPFKDVLQEVNIRLWQLFETKYDPDISLPNVFLVGHVDMSILSIVRIVREYGYFTGKHLNGRAPSSGAGELYKRCVSIDKNLTQRDRQAEFLSWLSPETIINVEDDISFNIDKDIIVREIKKALDTKQLRDLFQYLVIDEMTQQSVADKMGLNQGVVSRKLSQIRDIAKDVLINLGYLNAL